MSSLAPRPAGHTPDWATVNRWIDAGKPPIHPDGTWEPPALAAAPHTPPSNDRTQPKELS